MDPILFLFSFHEFTRTHFSRSRHGSPVAASRRVCEAHAAARALSALPHAITGIVPAPLTQRPPKNRWNRRNPTMSGENPRSSPPEISPNPSEISPDPQEISPDPQEISPHFAGNLSACTRDFTITATYIRAHLQRVRSIPLSGMATKEPRALSDGALLLA